MRRAFFAIVCVLATFASATAQQHRIRRLESELARLEPDTAVWYRTTLALIDAWRNVDLRETAARAQDLWRRAREHSVPDVAAAAAASAAFALSLSEGPVQAKVWHSRFADPGDGADPGVHGLAHLMRAREFCVTGRHADELAAAIEAQRLFEQAGDWYYRIVAAMVCAHAAHDRGLAPVRRLMEQAAEAGAGDEVAHLRLPMTLLEVDRLMVRGDVDGARRKLEQVERMAAEFGDVCGMAALHMVRFDICMAEDQRAQAALLLEKAGREYARLHLAAGLIQTMDLAARMAIEAGETKRAREWIEREREIMNGRGWSQSEAEMLFTRYQLAVKEGDSELAEQLDRELLAVGRREERELARYLDVTEKLAEAERANADYERELRQKELEITAFSRAMWKWCALGGGIVLLSLLTVSWRARRRQAEVNRILAEKVEELQEVTAARRNLEERMQQLERTEGLGTLAAGIAHDFNNLLTSIVGGAELLRARLGDEEGRDLAEMMLSAGQQGARLCRQLQSYSGGAPLQRTTFDVHEVVREMLPTLAASVKDSLSIHLEPAAEQVAVSADRVQFEQILLNLVQNSHEAGADRVAIAIRRVEVEADDGSGRVVAELEIEDDGAGMDEEVRLRIFDPFFTTRFPGRGLGLAVVFGGVRRHDGEIHVDSEPGRGTRFRIRLPIVEEAVILPSPPPSPPPLGTLQDVDAEVVIVDDEAIVRNALTSLLQGLGVDSHAFADGEQAVRFVAGLSVDRPVIAFVDLTMPGADGTEVVRRLRELGRPLRAVLMSGHGDDYVQQCAEAVAVERVLAKPFLAEDVRALLDDLADTVRLGS